MSILDQMPTELKDYLSGLKVVELASVLAGPMAGMFFAELGAEVIKIENPSSGGDVTRGWRLPSESSEGLSAYYASINYKKSSRFLDLKHEADYKQLIDLVREADIVLSNYADHVATKLKVDFATLAALNPRLIYAQLYAFDSEDPRPGYDLIMQAETGFMHMNGQPDGPPTKMPVALIDIMAAHQIKEATLLALLQRQLAPTPSPQKLSISLYQSAIAALANQGSNYLMAQHSPTRMGSHHPNIAPYGDIFQTADQQLIILAVGSDSHWQKLGKTLNLAAQDIHTFDKNKYRVSHRKDLTILIQNAIGNVRYQDLSNQLNASAIPFCKVMPIEEVFEHPLAQQMIRSEIANGQPTCTVSTIAFDFK